MPSPLAIPGAPEQGGVTPERPKFYTVGTLRYDQRQLYVLFFWLMWNDFSIMLFESIGSINGILMKNRGATFTQMALLGSIGGFITPWINPWVSTWSDRHRGPYGRRRPFLFWAAPFCGVFIMAVPFMPGFYRFLLRIHFADGLLTHLPMNGEVLFIGGSGLISGLFNAVVMAIFSYLYWDVVPEPLMGRFQSLSKIATLTAGLVWSFCIYGLAEHHPKAVYVGTGTFCLAIYLVSVWQIKEGEYPPPDVHKRGGVMAPLRAYFLECYSEPYYLWIFVSIFFYQLGNQGNGYQFWYQYLDLKLSMGTIGWIGGWSTTVTTAFGMLCGFAIGSFTDRLKGVRLMGPCYILAALLAFASFFFVRDQWTLLVSATLRSLANFGTGIVVGAFTIEVFPREKLGQFCSAQALFYQLPINLLGVPIAMFFDHIKYNRLGYLWSALFYFLGGLCYCKVYFNWMKRRGHTPVPHAG